MVSEKDKRTAFFRIVFGQSEGVVCLAFMTANKKQFRESFYEYPAELEQMHAAIEENKHGHNVYFCPQLFSRDKRQKQYISITPNIWSDLDTCDPEELLVEPSVVIESSPGRYQALWALEKPLEPDDAEDISRRIAYRHADAGADRSGWDLTQLLRVPGTYNYKYNLVTPEVKVISANRNVYRASDFKEYPETAGYQKVTIPIPAPEDLPQSADDLLQERRLRLNPKIWQLYNEEPTVDWSKALWNLQMLLFEAGFTREETFVIAREAKCNKYERDGRPMTLLWKDVCRAESRAVLNKELLVPEPTRIVSLMTAAEREHVENLEDTFVERYQRWASSLGDAAPQYHQAGAFICLSSMLCGSIRLPTSYGTIIPNVWFMILADTTLTRKTTAMDIAMDLIDDVDKNIVMATDGSIEGLLTSLATRPGKPSIFLRDEFSGLLEQMTKKEYMAGMPELLTKLYDGKMQKRILRKETIEVRDPRLIVFAGGIKSKITDLLTFEQVSSGFMPRFIFITAESDIKRIRPIGPPSNRSTEGRDAIMEELQDIKAFYDRIQQITVEKLKTTFDQKVLTDATMTDDAWVRYNKLETQLLDIGIKSDKPEVLTPVGDRLAKSILKCALLIAASQRRGADIQIELDDLLRAIKYGEQWREHGSYVMDQIGQSSHEKMFDTLYQAIKKKDGVSRSVLMRTYHLTARDTTNILETLEQRGMIARTKQGRTEMLYAIL